MSDKKYTETDLERLIEEKLSHHQECGNYPEVCKLIQSDIGRRRAISRIMQIILEDGITYVGSAIASLETELLFSNENEML